MSSHNRHHHTMRYRELPYFLVGLSVIMNGWGLLSCVGLVGGSVWIALGGGLLIVSTDSRYSQRMKTSIIFSCLDVDLSFSVVCEVSDELVEWTDNFFAAVFSRLNIRDSSFTFERRKYFR